MAGFFPYFSNRTERLLDGLEALLRIRLSDAFAPETILIQGRGMERYLSLQLARRMGVAGNIDFPYPGRFVESIIRAAGGGRQHAYPFDIRTLTFRLMSVLPELLARPSFSVLRENLSGAGDARLYQLCRQIADVFDQYAVHEPRLLAAWSRGDISAVRQADRWQPELWQAVLLATDSSFDPMAGLESVELALLDPNFVRDHLPARIIVFGVSSVRGVHREILIKLARVVDVHVFCLSPVESRPTGHYQTDLLERSGVVIAEFRAFLEEQASRAGLLTEDFVIPQGSSCLEFLQRQLLLDRQEPAVAPDGTVHFHSCHTPYREVEVLRDHLLDLFERRPDISPSDVLVLTPDIPGYAPLVDAVFGNPEHPQTRIPFRVADSRPGEGAELITALLSVLRAASGRLTTRDFLQLLEEAPVAAHSGLEESELEWVRIWLREVGIRWGWDGQHRESLGLPAFGEGSWRSGLDRLLLGLTLPAAQTELMLGVSAFTDIEGEGVDTLGRLARLARNLREVSLELSCERNVRDWGQLFRRILFDFTGRDASEAPVLGRLLSDWDRAFIDGLQAEFLPAPFILQLEELTLEASAGFAFPSGGVLFAAMLPMRAIPYRVICLLGMNEAAFPGRDNLPEFHLLAHERSGTLPERRTDDRVLFLETLISVRDELYISYVGQDMYSNRARHPSVVVAELREALAGGEYSEQDFTSFHRLQGYAPAYFDRTQSRRDMFSYSKRYLTAAQTLLAPSRQPGPFFEEDLPPVSSDQLDPSMDALIDFFRAPARAFLRQRFGFSPREREDLALEEEDVLPNALSNYWLQEFLTRELLEGRAEAELLRAARGKGLLSPGSLGDLYFDRELRRARVFAAQLETVLPEGYSTVVEGFVPLGTRRLAGRLNVSQRGVFVQRPGAVRGIDYINAWIQHLFLQMLPETERLARDTYLISRQAKHLQLEITRFAPLEKSRAFEHLETLLLVYEDGLRRPVPFFWRAALEYVERSLNDDPGRALYHARTKHEPGRFGPPGESQKAYNMLCFRRADPLAGEALEFCRLSKLVFEPILENRIAVPVDWEVGLVYGS